MKAQPADTAPAESEEQASTRQRCIDAAIASILDLGFYRASSNEIARRAGFTWGAIQRQFGTREALLSAVYEDGVQRLVRLHRDARVTGSTTERRIESLFEIMRSFYDRPEFLAYLQIGMNFLQDQNTSDETVATIGSMSHRIGELERTLTEQVFGAPLTAAQRPAASMLYFAIRDFWVGKQITTVTASHTRDLDIRMSRIDQERRLLVRALTPVIEAAIARRR